MSKSFGQKQPSAVPDSSNSGESHVETYLRFARSPQGPPDDPPAPYQKKLNQIARELGPEAVRELINALEDENINVQKAAAEALENIGDPRTLESLGVLLTHNEEYVRYLAEGVINELLPLADERARDAALKALQNVDNPEAQRRLAALMAETSMNLYYIVRQFTRNFFRKHPTFQKLRDFIKDWYSIPMSIAIIGWFISMAFYPLALMLFFKTIAAFIALGTLALTIFRAYRVYHPALDPSTGKKTSHWFVTVISILFFGIFLCSLGPIGVPGLLTYISPMLCPDGMEIDSEVAMRQWDLPGLVVTVSQEPVCSGKQGMHEPGKAWQVLSGMIMYLLYSSMCLTIVYAVKIAVKKRPFFALRPYVGFFISLIIFAIALNFTLFDPFFREVISLPVNWLIYGNI